MFADVKQQNENFWAKIKELGGWKDGDKIRFPTVFAKSQFEKWCVTGKNEQQK